MADRLVTFFQFPERRDLKPNMFSGRAAERNNVTRYFNKKCTSVPRVMCRSIFKRPQTERYVEVLSSSALFWEGTMDSVTMVLVERGTGLPLDLVVLINSFLYERLTDENFKQAIALWFRNEEECVVKHEVQHLFS